MCIRLVGFLAAALACSIEHGTAEDWPIRPIRVIVPLGAGSATDIVPRIVFEQVSKRVGQPIIIENRVGGGGTVGAAAVAAAEPDGYTVLAHSSAHTISPSVYPRLPYDTIRDFAGITPLGSLPNVLVVSPDKHIHTVQELVSAARQAPGSMNFGSGGTGTPTHLNAERFRLSAGIEAQHIPFKGATEALSELIAGRIDFYFSPILPALSSIRDGKLVALAVSTGQRASLLPEVPTTLEAGFPESDYNFWIGTYVPRKTPKATVSRLHEELVTALKNPAVHERLETLGVDDMIMEPEQLDAFVRRELEINARLAKAAGIAAQ